MSQPELENAGCDPAGPDLKELHVDGACKKGTQLTRGKSSPNLIKEKVFFIANLLVRNHFIIEIIMWTGRAPRRVEVDRLRVGRGAARAEDAEGTPTQSHVSPSILVYEVNTWTP